MARPVFIEPVSNKDQGDCTISCLVMWTGKPYPDVIACAPVDAHKKGMYQKDILATSERLGTILKTKRRYDIREDDGILMLTPEPKKGRSGHAVLLLNGMVLDPYNGRLWMDVETYLRVERYRPGVLLMEEE